MCVGARAASGPGRPHTTGSDAAGPRAAARGGAAGGGADRGGRAGGAGRCHRLARSQVAPVAMPGEHPSADLGVAQLVADDAPALLVQAVGLCLYDTLGLLHRRVVQNLAGLTDKLVVALAPLAGAEDEPHGNPAHECQLSAHSGSFLA